MSPQRTLLHQYCITCHNQRLKTAGLTLDTLDVTRVGAGAAVWEKVLRSSVLVRCLPLGDRDRITPNTPALWRGWKRSWTSPPAAEPYPGRTPIFHRLNRVEYQNAIRDLLAIDIDASSMLPGDHAAFGFDNIAELLKVSPDLLDAYLSAANKISRLAVATQRQGWGLPPTTFRSLSCRVIAWGKLSRSGRGGRQCQALLSV